MIFYIKRINSVLYTQLTSFLQIKDFKYVFQIEIIVFRINKGSIPVNMYNGIRGI
jgi:hypothetical protein